LRGRQGEPDQVLGPEVHEVFELEEVLDAEDGSGRLQHRADGHARIAPPAPAERPIEPLRCGLEVVTTEVPGVEGSAEILAQDQPRPVCRLATDAFTGDRQITRRVVPVLGSAERTGAVPGRIQIVRDREAESGADGWRRRAWIRTGG